MTWLSVSSTAVSEWNVKRRIVCAVLLSAVCLCPEQSSGQDLPIGVPGADWGRTRESRRVVAQEWLREMESTDNNIATLSPAEAAGRAHMILERLGIAKVVRRHGDLCEVTTLDRAFGETDCNGHAE